MEYALHGAKGKIKETGSWAGAGAGCSNPGFPIGHTLGRGSMGIRDPVQFKNPRAADSRDRTM